MEAPDEAGPKSPGAALEKKLESERPESGWAAAGSKRRAAIAAFAEEYKHFIGSAKTVRRAVTGLTLLALSAGARPLPEKGSRAKPGERFFLTHKGKSFALLLVGEAPPSDGLDVFIASLDSPRFDLKRRPWFRKEGFVLVETRAYGAIDLKSWLVTPLALHGYVSRKGEEPTEITIGEDPGDPVLVFPDLLPHLARKVQKKIIVTAEGMDAIVGLAPEVTEDGVEDERALLELLADYGIRAGDFEVGEFSLIPAYAPTYIGVDRALLAAYGHAFAAQAYAAARAILGADKPRRSTLLLCLERGASGVAAGDTGSFFIRHAISTVLAAFDTRPPSELTLRRVLAKSRALVANAIGGEVNGGIVLNPRFDDADPELVRELLNALDAADVPYQFPEVGPKGAWWSPARSVSTLGMRAMELSVPIADRGSPLEVLSTLDLYDGYRAYRAFMERTK